MKKILLFVLVLFTCNAIITAQTDVTLNILHKLGEEDFELFASAENNLGHAFKTKRLEYYISQVSLIHDGGQETAIDDLYILVDAAEATSIEIGNYDVIQMEAIRFHIGVEDPANHSDPASYPAEHPLAPQSPSMHWGWASGYRFIAFEGNSGPNLDQDCQIHGLGDQNYHQTEVTVDFLADNGTLEINLAADYTRGMENIEMNSGVFNHGFNGEAAAIIENFRDYVFSQSNETVSTQVLEGVNKFEIFPNPSTGTTSIQLVFEATKEYQLQVQTLTGSTIQSFEMNELKSNFELELEHAGMYFVTITDGIQLMTKKLIISK